MAVYTAQSATTRPVYDKNSPYAKTVFFGNYLDLINLPTIPKLASDQYFTVNRTYQYRPDLLAYDLYGDANLWWVFAVRNPNTITDPVFGMKPGTKIFLPKKETITAAIGL
jgi:hypothetical protein